MGSISAENGDACGVGSRVTCAWELWSHGEWPNGLVGSELVGSGVNWCCVV